MNDIPAYLRPVPGDRSSFIIRHDHGISQDRLIELTNSSIKRFDRLRDYLDHRPDNLQSFARLAGDLAGYFHVLKPGSPEVTTFLTVMARAVGAAGMRLAPGDAPVEIELTKGPAVLPRLPEGTGSLTLGDVIDGYYAAIATGDTTALALLAQVPLDRLKQTPPRAVERCYAFDCARGLQSWVNGDRAGMSLLVKAMQGCNSLDLAPGERDYAQFLESPAIEVLLVHSEPDVQARSQGDKVFDDRLRNALQMHRRYWDAFEPTPGLKQNNDPAGFIALGPLAAVALRQNAGLPVGITSDYLPISVIARNPQPAPEAVSA